MKKVANAGVAQGNRSSFPAVTRRRHFIFALSSSSKYAMRRAVLPTKEFNGRSAPRERQGNFRKLFLIRGCRPACGPVCTTIIIASCIARYCETLIYSGRRRWEGLKLHSVKCITSPCRSGRALRGCSGGRRISSKVRLLYSRIRPWDIGT